jgi:hypothetical protein
MNWLLDNIHLCNWACVHHDRPDNTVLKDGARDDKCKTESSEDLEKHTLRPADTSGAGAATARRQSRR